MELLSLMNIVEYTTTGDILLAMKVAILLVFIVQSVSLYELLFHDDEDVRRHIFFIVILLASSIANIILSDVIRSLAMNG